MKKIMMMVLVSLFVVGGMSAAQAVVVGPGVYNLPTTGTAPASYGAVLANTGWMPFTVGGVSGTVRSTVYNNVGLTGGLLFEYEMNAITDNGINAVGAMSAYDFKGFTVDADYDPSKITSLIPVPHFPAAVDNDGFGTIYARFSHPINAGESVTLYIQTNAQYFKSGGFSFIGAGTQSFGAYAPTATPEPATVSLLGMGLLGLLGFRRKTTV